ncbi:MAG TPA: hypothetical protein VN886_19630 [Acidimicrobiales bacterium]|nr:hypothetical protein [Acidimicrobiales bacterium]
MRAAVPPRVGDGLGHEPDDQVLRREVLTGREIHADSGRLRLSDVFEILPVAALRASTT